MTSTITKAEVLKNNQRKNLWLLIHDDVYDVTNFLGEHPGGEDTLLEAAGADATQAFEDVGHSEDARELLQKYKIGTLPYEEKAAHKQTPASANPCSPKSSIRTLPTCTKTSTPTDRKSSCSHCDSVESCLEANKPKPKSSGKFWRKFDDSNDSKGSKSTRFVVPPEKCQQSPTTTGPANKIIADPNSPVKSHKKNKSNWKWYALAALLLGALAVGAMVVKKNS